MKYITKTKTTAILFLKTYFLITQHVSAHGHPHKDIKRGYKKGSEIIPKDDVPDDVGRPKHVARLSIIDHLILIVGPVAQSV